MTPDIWKLREWLTIDQAAQYLSSAIDDEVSQADILRLGLDGHLRLSVHLPSDTKGWFHPDNVDTTTRPTSMTRIEGLWDVLIVGAGKRQIEHDYHFLADLPFISIDGIAGAWVERDGERRQLEPFRGSTGLSTRPPSAFSESGVLAVRVSELESFATRVSSDTSPKGSSPSLDVSWKDYWRLQDAWTVREFALLCCGLNPNGVDHFPDNNMEQYNEARDSINRAVRVKTLRAIDELAWPATGAEVMYEAIPAFKPYEVASWAAKRYPSTFPYAEDAWERDEASADAVEKPLGERERGTLLKIIAGLVKAANIDISKPSKAAQCIEALVQEAGATVSARAIENHLNRIPDVLERRDTLRS
jgi:hypothetical protein